MGLAYEDFRKSRRLYSGKQDDRFYFDGRELIKIKTGEYFIRTDFHSLPLVGFFPELEIFDIRGKLVLVYSVNHMYTYVEPVKVIESRTTTPFTGFEPNKNYELTNGQIWQQVNGPYAPNHMSGGRVLIINDRKMKVDNWEYYPEVRLVNNKYI